MEITEGKGVPVVDDSIGKDTFQGSIILALAIWDVCQFWNALGLLLPCP
jgi:hypothetical protein